MAAAQGACLGLALLFVVAVLGSFGACGCATTKLDDAIAARAAACPSRVIACDDQGACACIALPPERP